MTAEHHPDYQRIEQAIHFLQVNFDRQPDLEEVARQVHLSPFHFQRLFSDWAGISPKRFLQSLTADHLKSRLHETRNLLEAADLAGMSTPSRVHDLFVTLEAVTPQEYRSGGAGLPIRYGFGESPFGECLLATTERGICWLAFVPAGTHEIALDELQAAWPAARLTEEPQMAEQLAQTIFQAADPNRKFHLLVKGTNFQVKVWNALLRIPEGGVASYQAIAQTMGMPGAARAVGSAVGANHLAYLIPCHRVIRQSGAMGEYRWSSPKKGLLLGWEMSQLAGQTA
ncbi:MAG: methylated-DNA--[protein]-cysteine S-methyltransferase [Saprospiraceae bacterium]